MYLPKSVLAIFILLLFVATALTGLHATMMTDAHGNMPSCPFMNDGVSFCQMGIVEHLNAWQSLFAAIIPSASSVVFVFTLLLIAASPEVDKKNRDGTTSFLYNKLHSVIAPLVNPLRLALSNGIVHPKVYDFGLIS